ncbi:MAG TPA: hypothetical protein VGG64_15990 [Pirellulales bacterium]|jgi:hypothetical protein
MPSRGPHSTSATLEPLWQEISEFLECQKEQIFGQIRGYPSPITGCDQQFNFLLEEQARISQEMSRMRTAMQECLSGGKAHAILAEFLRTSTCLDEETAGRFRSRLADTSENA